MLTASPHPAILSRGSLRKPRPSLQCKQFLSNNLKSSLLETMERSFRLWVTSSMWTEHSVLSEKGRILFGPCPTLLPRNTREHATPASASHELPDLGTMLRCRRTCSSESRLPLLEAP